MAEHKPVLEEVTEWRCIYGDCDCPVWEDCPVITITACDTCRTYGDGEIEGLVTWPCEFAPKPPISGTTHDPEPQPGDGPDYHADHAAWVARQEKSA